MDIFEIEKNTLDIISQLEENGGEITDELEELININKNDIKEKLTQYYRVINKINSEVEKAEFEVKRIKGKVDIKKKTVETILSYCEKAIALYGIEPSKSKAKKKPKEVALDFGLKAVVSYSEAVEISDKVTTDNLIALPDDLKPFTTVSYSIKTDLSDFEKIREDLLKLLEQSPSKTNIVLSFNKDEIKSELVRQEVLSGELENLTEEDNFVHITNAQIKINSNVKFK